MMNKPFRIDTLTISHCAVAYAALLTGRAVVRDGQSQGMLLDLLQRGEAAISALSSSATESMIDRVENIIWQDSIAPMAREYSAGEVFAAVPE